MTNQNRYVLIRYNKAKHEKEFLMQSDDLIELKILKLRMLKDLPFQELEDNIYWIDDVQQPLREPPKSTFR
jgi:hypothetical protein